MIEPPRRCTKCGVEKPLGEFHVDRSKSSGRRPDCRECANAAWRARYRADPERELARVREYWRRRPALALLRLRRGQAARRLARTGSAKTARTLALYDAELARLAGARAGPGP